MQMDIHTYLLLETDISLELLLRNRIMMHICICIGQVIVPKYQNRYHSTKYLNTFISWVNYIILISLNYRCPQDYSGQYTYHIHSFASKVEDCIEDVYGQS